MKNTKEKILLLIKQNNQSADKHISTENIAEKLSVKRNTVSYYLNQLVNENKVIKIDTRPVVFIDKETAQKNAKVKLSNEYKDLAAFKETQKEFDVFEKVIGHAQSLSGPIKKLRAAASYPGRLPILINGPTGTGKSYLAEKFFEYCREEGVISSKGRFVSFNCAEYADNPELLTSTLFGYVKGAFTGAEEAHDGLFDKANNGMLFLDEVHRLDPKGQEKLFSYLDTGTISALGDAGKSKSVNVRLICATTEDVKSCFLATFMRRIPVQITMPALRNRTASEIRSLIIYFYLEHAKKIKKNIQISNQVFITLNNTSYDNNVGQLKNDVLLSVASALSNKNDVSNQEIKVKLTDLPQDILVSSINKVDQRATRSSNNIVVTPENDISDFFDVNQRLDYIKKAIIKIFTLYQDESFESFKVKAIETVNNLCDYLIFKRKALNVGELPLDLIKQRLNQEVGYLQDDLKNDFNGNLIVAIAYYFYFRQENHWQLSIEEGKLADKIINEMVEVTYTEPVVETIISVVNNSLNLYTDEVDKLFLTIYLSGAQRKKATNLVHCILLAHGYSTASSIADTVNKIVGKPLLDSFDMPIDITPTNIANKVANYIHVRGVTTGLILMADMGSLEKIPELIKADVSFPIVIFNNVSTQLALFVAESIKKQEPLQKIVKKMNNTIHNDYRIIYPTMIKENVIIVCCTTGVGTASKIKNMIVESLPAKRNVTVKAYSYDLLTAEDQEDTLKQKYNILTIIGTANPKYTNVPYISIDQLVNGSKITLLESALKKILSKKELYDFNDSILRNFTIERVINSLTILDTKAVIKNIDFCIKKLNSYMEIRLSNQTVMALYVHVSCMIERIIRNQSLNNNPINFKEDENSKRQVEYIRISLSQLEKIYNIKIPLTEIKYIYELIFNTEENIFSDDE
ncbi:sigma 54-interacting transcriptional regulator [Lactobacillus sp. ESL0679]|uniref:sigma 54-interacting transcriptional regulator n=1 Tax=Lactobacillus sp. ESL0679 TaxID=2983209 RepID=UPI0023F72419|nr:sigma 54-interacting transcriptional regulator [Lactobacillus sp. ESL0679]MDF7683240.1 sigma 54-interacting transcriptional regulator [Lactobacillus sp. ESL0679]